MNDLFFWMGNHLVLDDDDDDGSKKNKCLKRGRMSMFTHHDPPSVTARKSCKASTIFPALETNLNPPIFKQKGSKAIIMSSSIVSEIPNIVKQLRNNFLAGTTKKYEWRIKQLKNLKKMMEENQERFNQAMERDLCQARFLKLVEVKMCTVECETAINELKQWMKPQNVEISLLLNQPASGYIVREPYGTVLLISPWNYPVSLVVKPLIGAIAAGNNMVVKPSEVAPATSALFAELIPQYLDKENIVVIEGGVDVTTELLKQRFDYIFYTGNTSVGKIVMKAASEHLTPVTLELGGKSPAIVAKDADLNITAKRLVWGKFLNLGQTCVAPDYVFVDKSIKDEFTKTMKEMLVQFYGTDPQKSDDYSRIINERHCYRLEKLLNNHGGNVLVGGKVDPEDRYVEPTIILDPKYDSELMKEEIFGPILPILTMDDINTAIDYINKNEKPLALYLFSSDKDLKKKILDKTSSGAVVFNDCVVHNSVSELPFGGVGYSGIGAYNGKKSFETFSHEKPVLDKGTLLDAPARYPPYTDGKIKLLNFAFRKFAINAFLKRKFVPALLVLGISILIYYLTKRTL